MRWEMYAFDRMFLSQNTVSKLDLMTSSPKARGAFDWSARFRTCHK